MPPLDDDLPLNRHEEPAPSPGRRPSSSEEALPPSEEARLPTEETLADYEPMPVSDQPRSSLPWVAGALVLIGVVVAIAVWAPWRRSDPVATTPAQPPAATPAPPAEVRTPLGPPVEPVDLPPLDLTDALVRELVGRLSSAPAVAAWLTTDGLIRNFVVSLDNVAEGRSPARHLRKLAPAGPFQVSSRGDTLTIDPRSYDRYNALADAVASLDAAGLATLYSTLKPRLVEAYTELGHPDGDIDAAVQRAIERLLATPEAQARAAVVAPKVNYRYADPALEQLSQAQKQLLRMGPRNRQIVLDKLGEVAEALGLPHR